MNTRPDFHSESFLEIREQRYIGVKLKSPISPDLGVASVFLNLKGEKIGSVGPIGALLSRQTFYANNARLVVTSHLCIDIDILSFNKRREQTAPPRWFSI